MEGKKMEEKAKVPFKNTYSRKVIYIFTIEDETHKGLLKIGDATLHTDKLLDQLPANCKELNKVAMKRIHTYTNTAGIVPKLLHTELAIRSEQKEDGKEEIIGFRDYDVHRVLENSGIKREKLQGSTGREWYRIELETAIASIEAVKKSWENLGNTTKSKYTPIVFRPEQTEAIKRTVKQFKKNNRMLWNAKMRFGKTLSALQVVKESGFQKTLIITHRPVVNDGWYEDFQKIFHNENYLYGSKEKGYTVETLNKKGNPFLYFASIQDLRGSEVVGGKYDKNDDIFQTIWDCVIVDEAHEGTKTTLGDETIKAIVKEEQNKTKLLALSGTPFNIIGEYEENEIYTWDYIMEQRCKAEWDKKHFGDSNPYEDLPKLCIYTYNLGELLKNKSYISYEDKAFNFTEFFRTRNIEKNGSIIEETDQKIEFVHEEDVVAFLNLMTRNSGDNNYPYSKEEYIKLFKHTLWVVPGVREAKALKTLMSKHKVFGSGQFDIVNVAGNDDEEAVNALHSVKEAIKSADRRGAYTITLSCGKLTTGVTIKEWTAVFMLAGSYSTSASNYLQTIFRVQSPCNKDGMVKERAYVFDFAPDRTLKMVSEAVSVSAKSGKTKSEDRKILGDFLNYCPVISILGSTMEEYKVARLLQQLKKAYVEKVVRSGFDDMNLYNDKLFKLDDVEIQKFDQLRGIIGTSKGSQKQTDIILNQQGLTNEEYEEVERIEKKKKKERTQEEQERLEELQKKKDVRRRAISILRGISIRMPLLIYGTKIPYEKDITIDQFVDNIDENSWNEFMPSGVTKEMFQQFKKYYDEDIFIAAGRKIRDIVQEADTLDPTERVKKIASLFSYFKNPDKETVLTPWRVVNLHMSDCLGGYDFWDEQHEDVIEEPRFVDRGKVTKDTFANPDAKILEINSKTGLYPLYVAYSIYRAKCKEYQETKGLELNIEIQRKLWDNTIENNVFVVCKTPMAKEITKRTLVGYSDIRVNASYFDDLINQMKYKQQQFVEKILRTQYWKKGEMGKMKFDAIVGNPPYMEIDGGAQASAKPIYHHFVTNAKALKPDYCSFIIPTRWYSGGKGLDAFRDEMLNDKHIQILYDCITPDNIFPNTNIRGGICYFLWNSMYNNRIDKTNIITLENGKAPLHSKRDLKWKDLDIFIRYSYAISVVEKVEKTNDMSFMNYISVRKPFGLDGKFIKTSEYHSSEDGIENPIKCYGKAKSVGYIEENIIKSHKEWIYKWKVLTAYANNIGTELNDDNLNSFVAEPKSVCTETFIVIGGDLELNERMCINITKYLKTRFLRFLLSLAKSSQHATAKTYRFVPMQDFTAQSDINWNKTIPEIDKQLYKKYGLSNEEIAFIEEKIKPMD